VREDSEPWFVRESRLYAKVRGMMADVVLEVVSLDLGMSLEVGEEISVRKRVPVLCGWVSCTGKKVHPFVSRDSRAQIKLILQF